MLKIVEGLITALYEAIRLTKAPAVYKKGKPYADELGKVMDALRDFIKNTRIN